MPTQKNIPKGPDISCRLFGGVLTYDGAGHYPGLEMLNLVFNGEDQDDLLPTGDTKFILRAHDFARKLVWSKKFDELPNRRDVLFDDDTEDAIRHLMACLQLEIPSKTEVNDWSRAHFFPYTRSLIHWDARDRQKVRIERRYLRGAGALAYRVLREDANSKRKSECVSGFNALFPEESSTPLEQLARVLARHGKTDEKPSSDAIEAKIDVRQDEVEDLYRDGVNTILGHSELSSVARIRALMGWTSFWLVTMQHTRAYEYLGRKREAIICDCGAGHPQLRRAAQKSLKDSQAVILEAYDKAFAAECSGTDHRPPQAQRNSIRGFFWATAATVKLLNAWRGRRHFTLKLDILETLVLAAIPTTEEKSFEWFVYDWLYGRCGLVVGRRAAEQAKLLDSLDASIFEDNEAQLQRQMAAAGLLTEYSDATRMVSVEALA